MECPRARLVRDDMTSQRSPGATFTVSEPGAVLVLLTGIGIATGLAAVLGRGIARMLFAASRLASDDDARP